METKNQNGSPLAGGSNTANSSDQKAGELRFQCLGNQPAMDLEQTLKVIRQLSRLSHQRDRLIVTIDDLAAFEVRQEDLAEELAPKGFQRCELCITDDRGERFSTKNPFIIDWVAKGVVSLCTQKLIEIEASITLSSNGR